MKFKCTNNNLRYCQIIAVILSISFLTGCMKVQDEDVEVIIIDTYYEEYSGDYYLIGGTIGCDSSGYKYYTVVEYNGEQYTVEDDVAYEKYKDKIGEKAIGIMRYFIYEDGDIQCAITRVY